MNCQSPHDRFFERLFRGGAVFSGGLIIGLIGIAGLMLVLSIGKGILDLLG